MTDKTDKPTTGSADQSKEAQSGTTEINALDAGDTDNSMATGTSAEKRSRAAPRPFPRMPLADALKVVNAIKDKNAGKPFPPNQIADAIGRKPRSSDFEAILSAAQAYGLVEGGTKATQVSLTDLGRRIAYPSNQKDEVDAQFAAFMKIDLFRQVFDHYADNKLPEEKYLKNTLISSFKVLEIHVDDFIKMFEANCRVLGINVSDSVSLKNPSIEVPIETKLEIATQSKIVRSGRYKAFVIMPFVEKNPARAEGFFKEVYRSLISLAANAAGFDVDTANRPGSDIIQSTIINEILDADLLIADLTDHNPNVLFELGLRLAYNKGPTALIKSQDTPRLFDVDNMIRVYEYNQVLWRSTLEIDISNLEQSIRATWDNRESGETYLNILRRPIR